MRASLFWATPLSFCPCLPQLLSFLGTPVLDRVWPRSYLGGPSQQQPSGVAGPDSGAGVGLVAVVGVVLPSRGPLPVVEGLLLAAHVLVQEWPQGAHPGHVGMGQQGCRGRQLASSLRAQEAVGCFGQDHYWGQGGMQAPTTLDRPRGPWEGPWTRGGGG